MRPILAGREFGENDQRVDTDAAVAPGAVVATLSLVLNEKAAYTLFGKDNPIGKHLQVIGASTKWLAWSRI